MRIVTAAPSENDSPSGPCTTLPLDFSVQWECDDGHVVVSVCGELDAFTGPMVQASLESAVASQGNRSVVIDLGATTFIDPSGLKALVGAHRWLEAMRGDLVLTRPTVQTRKVLEITGLNRLLTVAGP